jgi:hypothetical protein
MPAVSSILQRLEYEILWPAMTVVFAAGLLLFFWGMVQFLWNVEEQSANNRSEGRQHMIWGIVGMFIMVSFWSLIAILDNTFGLGVFSGGAATDPGRNQIQSVDFGSINNGR